jgi:hypothetical protein
MRTSERQADPAHYVSPPAQAAARTDILPCRLNFPAYHFPDCPELADAVENVVSSARLVFVRLLIETDKTIAPAPDPVARSSPNLLLISFSRTQCSPPPSSIFRHHRPKATVTGIQPIQNLSGEKLPSNGNRARLSKVTDAVEKVGGILLERTNRIIGVTF